MPQETKAALSAFNVEKMPKPRERAVHLLTHVVIQLAESDPASFVGKMATGTEYLDRASNFFAKRFATKPFEFQKKDESYYRKQAVPSFHAVVSERFLFRGTSKKSAHQNIIAASREYYLAVLAESFRAPNAVYPHDDNVLQLMDVAQHGHRHGTSLERFVGRDHWIGAIEAAHRSPGTICELLRSWPELFDA